MDNLEEKYINFLISTNKAATATAFSRVFDEKIAHDRITRMLNTTDQFTSQSLWQTVKPLCREMESRDAVLIYDDTLIEKPDSSLSELIMYHFDHSKGRSIRSICMLTALLNSNGANIPVCIDMVQYNEQGEKKSKQEMMRNMLVQCDANDITFKHVLADTWYGSAENMQFIVENIKKDFIFPLKANRRVKLAGSRFYTAIADLELEEGKVYEALLQGYKSKVYLCSYCVKDGQDKPATLYLVTSDEKLDWNHMLTCYQRRWQVELFHRSVKQNTAIAKAPLRRTRAMLSHIYASVNAFIKLELLKLRHKMGHDSIKELIRYAANKASYLALEKLSTSQMPHLSLFKPGA